jgi:conjugative transfer signal peptidase TraF
MNARMPHGRDLPLQQWGDALRHRKQRQRMLCRRVAALACLLLGLGVTIALPPTPRLVWNASASAPIGLYSVLPPTRLQRGDLVVARLARDAARLAAERHYLPLGLPVVKHIAALPGDHICGAGTVITVDGKTAAMRLTADLKGRPLVGWLGCRTLHADQFLLLNPTVPDSFDGRYFGVTADRDILGRASPLWLR